jgi:hypothetical protein
MMLSNPVQSFIDIFADDLTAKEESYSEESSFQKEIGIVIAECIQNYANRYLKGDSNAERYHNFFLNVKKDTLTKFGQKNKIKSKSFKQLKPDYYRGVIYKIRAGEREQEFVLAIYYWFHIHAENSEFAKKIDDLVFRIYPQIEEKIRELIANTHHAKAIGSPQKESNNNVRTETASQPDHSKRNINLQIPTLTAEEWLNPLNQQAIPFIGRELELAQLDEFASTPEPFKIWAIVGPSGAGKTRLSLQWMLKSFQIHDWDKRILKMEDRGADYWGVWTPSCPTLIIIDYMFGFAETIQVIIKRCRGGLPHKVRLLVIDHVFPDDLRNLLSDQRWGFSESGAGFDVIQTLFFKKNPLDLRAPLDQEQIIHSILKQLSGHDILDKSIEEAKRYLRETENAWHPLFAALVGDALKNGKPYHTWNRRDLIYYYLEGHERLPWKRKDSDGQWAAAFIAAATARRGVSYSLLKNCVPESDNQLSSGYISIKNICQRTISKNKKDELAPFEPDILGETFFLLFLEALNDAPRLLQRQFFEMLSVGDERVKTQSAINFIGFIERLSLNLSNDDQDNIQTKNFWDSLISFLNPKSFSVDSFMPWAACVSIINAIDIMKDCSIFDKYHSQLESLNVETLLNAPKGYSELSINSAIIYDACFKKKFTACKVIESHKLPYNFLYKGFFLAIESTNDIKKHVKKIFDNNGQLDFSTIDLGIELISAARIGDHKKVKQLIEAGAETDLQDDETDLNALMEATLRGHAVVVKILVKAGAKLNLKSSYKRTALMMACSKRNVNIARTLIEAGADLNVANFNGVTVLSYVESCKELKDALISKDERTVDTPKDN